MKQLSARHAISKATFQVPQASGKSEDDKRRCSDAVMDLGENAYGGVLISLLVQLERNLDPRTRPAAVETRQRLQM